MAKREHQMPSVLKQDGDRPYWYIRYRVRILNRETKKFERKEKWHRLGDCDRTSKRQAERLRDQVVAAVNEQVFTMQNQILLTDFSAIYEGRHVPTLAFGNKYTSILKNHIVPAFGQYRLCDVRTEDVQEFLNDKAAAGLSWWTRNDLKGVLSGLFTKATDWGYWSGKNPTLRTTLGPKRTLRKKYGLTDEQIVRLINALPEPVRLMVATAVSTAIRVSELAGVKWGSIDLENGVMYVQETYFRGHVGETKTEESHRSLGLGVLTSLFREAKPANAGPDDYVFLIDGKPADDRAVLRQFIRPVAKQQGIYFKGFGWRTFRRMNLTALQAPGGVNVFEAMAQAGHTKPETTMGYMLLDVSRREKAVLDIQQRWLPESMCGNNAGTEK